MTEHRLKQAIIQRGVKFNYIADKLGISEGRLNHYLNGRRKMPADIEFRLAKELS